MSDHNPPRAGTAGRPGRPTILGSSLSMQEALRAGAGRPSVGQAAFIMLHPEIGATADWTDTPGVLAAVRDRRVRGNAMLTLPSVA